MATKQVSGSEWEPDAVGDEIRFDSFARKAGESLRSAAPEDGITAVVRQGLRQQTRRRVLEIGVVGVLVVSGIAVFRHSDNSEHIVDTPPQPTTPPTVSPVPTSIASAEDISQWFLDYTGNAAGPTSGEPVKFGVVMAPFEYRYDLNAAATYLNEQAGGVGGRPIELDVCQQSLTECADRFAADPAVVVVLESEWRGDSLSDSIGAALAGRKPLHTTYSSGGTLGVEYYPTYGETVSAMALQAEKLTAPGARILVIVADGEGFATPDVSSSLENRDVVTVQASVSASLVDTIRSAGATDAAAVVLAAPPFVSEDAHSPSNQYLCADLVDALDELGMRAAVIVDRCEPHDGWYKLDVGLNETSPDLQSGALPITTDMPGLGDTRTLPAIRTLREAGALLAVIRVINQLGGPAQATPAALEQAMRDFTGPVPLGAGPLDCSPTGKVAERVQPGSCVRFVDVHQFVHDRWINLAPIDLGT